MIFFKRVLSCSCCTIVEVDKYCFDVYVKNLAGYSIDVSLVFLNLFFFIFYKEPIAGYSIDVSPGFFLFIIIYFF